MKSISNDKRLIVILGPTATGKSDLAVDIALWLKKTQGKTAEIISADSRQIYKGLDIASGKITKKEMRGVIHHGLDIVSPKRKKMFSVSEFQTYTYKMIDAIYSRGNIPILCGGTGFYISSVVDGVVFPEVPPNLELRKKLSTCSLEKLQKTLIKLDPERYAEIDTKNSVRLVRAIEIAKELGKVPKVPQISKYDTLCIGIDTDDEVLKKKISKRIEVRMKKGMVNEVKELHEQGVTWKRMQSFGLEYGLLSELIRGKMSREQFTERLNFDIWHYVKRQRAWFKRNKDIVWLDVNDNEFKDKAFLSIVKFLKYC